MKKLIFTVILCCVTVSAEIRAEWKPKYNKELIQMHEDFERMREDMAVGYLKAVAEGIKEANSPEGKARIKKEMLEKGLKQCREQLWEQFDAQAIPTGHIYKRQYETEGGELYYLGETTNWSYLWPIIFVPFKSNHKIYCRPIDGAMVDGTIALEVSWISPYSIANMTPGKPFIYFRPEVSETK